MRATVTVESKPYHVRGITGVIRSLVYNPLPVLLPGRNGLIRHVIRGDIFALRPSALPHILEKPSDRDILTRVGPSLTEEIPRVLREKRSKKHAKMNDHPNK